MTQMISPITHKDRDIRERVSVICVSLKRKAFN